MDFNIDKLFEESNRGKIREIMPKKELPIHSKRLELIAERIIIEKIGRASALSEVQKALIKHLSEYICGGYKPQSGILIVGSKGCGKTTIMQGFIRYYNWLYNKVIREYNAKTLPIEIKARGIEWFYRRPIFIDDLGKESAITMEFGQRYDTWGDIFAIRYEMKSLTFATANYKIDGQITEIYGDVIADRMKEHFNIFELIGESYR